MFWNAKNAEVDLGDTKMSYVSFGSGEKTLILIPGLSDGLTTVRGKALVLAGPYKLFFDKYTVYMFSRKDRMPEGYSIRNMAEDQATAMEILGIRKACVMGVSEGGMIAQYLAIDHPEMVEKLVLSVTAPGANDVIKESVGRYLECAKRGDHKSLMIATAEDSYSPSRLKSYRKIYPILGMIGKPSDYGRFFINCNAILKFDATDELDKIKCPTLIIGGDEDKTVGVELARSGNGLYYLADEEVNGYISAKVIQSIDLGSHTLFIADVTDGAVLGDTPSATYAYYFANIKPKPEKRSKKGWVCIICGYIYEGEVLPPDFICPICKHPASDFRPVGD